MAFPCYQQEQRTISWKGRRISFLSIQESSSRNHEKSKSIESRHFRLLPGWLVFSVFSLSAEDFGKIILAYEPVWAIGTGKTASPEQAEEIHAYIRSLVAAKYGNEVAENTTILYGGSCKPSNAKELFAKPNVDGGLIGGAALKAADFKGIIDAFK